MPVIDPITLAQSLIRCHSVTPEDNGAQGLLAEALKPLGFSVAPLRFESPGTTPVENLYLRYGTSGPLFAFAGHTDVVPTGPLDGWSVDPFGGELIDGILYGRGACDMKGAIAAFTAAAAAFVTEYPQAGSIALIITGDEEAAAINGTAKIVEWMIEKDERPDACLVGEPTNIRALGDMIKIGRRGSLTGYLETKGIQGHVAYPQLADNPIPKLLALLKALCDSQLDDGTTNFQPSNLEITSIDVGNKAANVIPATARAVFNVRYNDRFSRESLQIELERRLKTANFSYNISYVCSGEAFLTPSGFLSELAVAACEELIDRKPELSTSGGTSDARFLYKIAPVIEFGLVGSSMHKVDERTSVNDLLDLTKIYRRILEIFFKV